MIKDELGNIIESQKRKTRLTYVLHLKDSQHEYPRTIGYFKLDKKTRKPIKDKFYVNRDPDLHYYWSKRAYGFNDKFIRDLDKDIEVIMTVVGSDYKRKIKVGEMLEKGEYLTFSKQGFEKQIFIKDCHFTLFD